MVNSTIGLLASGNTDTPLRALIYLACSQRPGGGFHQNFWINGEPYWRGIQLDEVAFPILLAWKLRDANALRDFTTQGTLVPGVAGHFIRIRSAAPDDPEADEDPNRGLVKIQNRAWPLLTGERGHYELAAGRDVGPYLRAMEGFATAAGLFPEQVWDAPDRPADRLHLGRPTGAPMPLMWAHAEYIKLLRSAHDGQVFDRIPAVAERYQGPRGHPPIEVWTFERRVPSVRPGTTLRVQAKAAFCLHWTAGEWSAVKDTASTPTVLGVEFVDIPIAPGQAAPIRFTFFWPEVGRWEGRDFQITAEGPSWRP